jgi:hypothetical protein
MQLACVDSSCVVAVLLRAPGGAAVRRELAKLDTAFAANLLEAEVKAAAAREGVVLTQADEALSSLRWVFPHRPMTAEFARILGTGYVRGADLWHLACALLLQESLGPMPFLTLDAQQAATARAVGLESSLA